MHIETLKLFNFRNLSNQTVLLCPEVNHFIGRNGQGKTNLIEAICFLSLSKSFRTANAQELITWGQDSTSVFARVRHNTSDSELGLSIINNIKQGYLNEQKLSSITEFVGRLICVSFSPSDLELVKGSPQSRRRFIDKHIVDSSPLLLKDLLDYSRALRNKNNILKKGVSDIAALDAWNLIMAEAAQKITSARQRFLSELQRHANQYYQHLSGNESQLALSLQISLRLNQSNPSLEDIFTKFKANSAWEISHGTTKAGPHKDDILILLNGRDASAFASQGQARSIVLALKLGVIDMLEQIRGEMPVVLLDDVDSELDQRRRNALYQLVLGLKAQVCVTGTAQVTHLAQQKNCLTMEIERGEIRVC